ncbi:rod shape-determining protein MreD [Tepidibacter formicigenes]|jgi:rod shape-determining protein MreD|uniref:Rod shape-determining protein MreD n=1 Tax=Tepidibacter formicigenes DSM 15518 TaxID=1123349 RepID=A0A1M6K173_9FIRM|nr:rod shape-determining protein MreD [Tepidibacter formicigenes]SHJ52706.1 rod shape-determining protein MreD [Tepidibacter formicigenes DSM 15518]
MKNFILVVLGITVVILENSVLNYIDIFSLSINMSIIYISIISLFLKRNQGAFIGLIVGLFKDILVGRFLGVNAVLFFLIGYIYGILQDKIFKDNSITIVILIFFSSIFESSINFIFFKSFFGSDKIIFSIYKGFIVIPLLNVIVALFVHRFLINFVKKLNNI